MDDAADNRTSAPPDLFDADRNVANIHLPANTCHVTTADQTLTTVLGSCVAVCVRDPDTGVGGMNHFMLPGAAGPTPANASLRYGPDAMDALIAALAAAGARLQRVEAKVFGGGQVLASLTQSRIGAANIAFALGDLAARNIPVVARDVGGCWPRRLCFRPATGQVRVRRLQHGPTQRFDPATGAFLKQHASRGALPAAWPLP